MGLKRVISAFSGIRKKCHKTKRRVSCYEWPPHSGLVGVRGYSVMPIWTSSLCIHYRRSLDNLTCPSGPVAQAKSDMRCQTLAPLASQSAQPLSRSCAHIRLSLRTGKRPRMTLHDSDTGSTHFTRPFVPHRVAPEPPHDVRSKLPQRLICYLLMHAVLLIAS